MTDSNLKKLLDEFASNSPDPPLAYSNLIEQIKRRRQRKAVALTAIAAFTLLATVGGSTAIGMYMINESDDLKPQREANSIPMNGITFSECGGHIQGQSSEDSPLTVTFHDSEKPEPGWRNLLRFKITITNRTHETITGLTGEAPDVFVTKDRIVVATPLARRAVGIPVDLTPGQAMTFAAAANLRPCGPTSTDHQILAPGTYELFVRQQIGLFDTNRLPTGETIEVQAGPWPISVT